MNMIVNRDRVGSSTFELLLFKLLYSLTFKRSRHLRTIIHRIEKDLEAVKNKQV